MPGSGKKKLHDLSRVLRNCLFRTLLALHILSFHPFFTRTLMAVLYGMLQTEGEQELTPSVKY